jgi:predicted naringenin-chalcone synthase
MILKEAHISGTGIATPYPVNNEQFLKIDEKMRRAHEQPEEVIARLKSLAKGTGIHTRHYVHPHWLEELEEWADLENHSYIPLGALKKDIFTCNNFVPPYHTRMQIFDETCVKLGIEAARNALSDWGGNPQEISHIFTTCTSGWKEPGIAAGVIQALDLSLNCAKAELNFNGCFSGATCLRLARDTVRAGDSKGVLVVAVEVASTHYDVTSVDISSLVAHSLFADGAAAIVLAPEGKWKYEKTGMSLVPDSKDFLKFTPPVKAEHSSYQMYLDRNVGKKLGQYFRQGPGKDLLSELHIGSNSQYPALGIHPGGPNILESLNEVFIERGWPQNTLQPSYEVLRDFGNLGSAAMLFVLAKTIKRIQENHLITMAFGPGITLEWAQLSKVH